MGETIKDNEVQKDTLKNEFELGEVLRLLSIGFNKHKIREKLGISKTNLSYYLRKLEISGNIKRIGKYEVQVLSSSKIHPRVTINQINSKLNKRGHAHNFKVIFPQELDDLRNKQSIKQLINENRIKPLKFNSLQFTYKRFTIWINKSTLTIYSNNSYYSDDALISKFTALKEADNLIRYLKDKFQIKGIYGIEIFREHYGLIFNEFAKWILEKGSKLDIKDKGNKSILWVDDSKEDDIGLKEFEGKNPIEINNADKLFESHLRTGWKVTPEYILNGFDEMKKDRDEFRKEIKEFAIALNKHIPAYEGMGLYVQKLHGEIKSLKKEISLFRKEEPKRIKNNLINGVQKGISDYF